MIANLVSDELAPNLRIGGQGPTVDRLQWDTKLYLALNGAVHDAAIAAWGLKGDYDSVRPISMIRYMGGLGQSSDVTGPSYNKNGLPLVPGLVEVITKADTAAGQPKAALAGHEGEIAIRAWGGNPADPKTQIGGVKWILATTWVPSQLPTFVTPAFQGYVSGHSTFSRAAAEVLVGITGSEYFPGGITGYTIEPGSLKFELGQRARSGWNGPPITTPRTRPVSRASWVASTSRRTTSPAGRWAPRVARRPGTWRSGTTRAGWGSEDSAVRGHVPLPVSS